VEAGKTATIAMQPPESPAQGLVRRVIDQVGFGVRAGNLVELSERIGSVAAPSISTVLELARSATKHKQEWQGAGERLRNVLESPLESAPDTAASRGASGESFQVMVAVELMSLPSEEAAEEARALGQTLLDSQDKVDSYLKSLLWQLWPMDAKPEEGRPLQPSASPGVSTATTPTKPGPYWFRIDSKDRRRNVCFALTILTGQDLNLILHQQDCGRIFVSQFMEHDGPNRDVDPLKTRRLDMAQRFLMGGELGQASSTLEPLLVDPHDLDPIAGSLGGHLLVKQGQIDRAGALGERLIELHPTLPDGYVLRALALSTKGRESDAEAAYRKALDLGFPLVAENTLRLASGASRARIAHPRVELLNRVVERLHPGLLWTAWIADPDWPEGAA